MDTLRLTNIAGFAQAYDGKLIRGLVRDNGAHRYEWLTCRFIEKVDMDDFLEAVIIRCKQFGLEFIVDGKAKDPGHKWSVTFKIEGIEGIYGSQTR